MATIVINASAPRSDVPFNVMPSATRLPGATSTSLTLDVTTGAALIILTGFGLTYDSQALPSGGTITRITYLADGLTTTWTATGFSVSAADFRANAATLGTFLFGGDDSIAGAAGGDRLQGYGGNDTITGGTGNDTLLGGTGNDSLFGGNDADSLVGGIGNDTLLGGVGSDTLVGSTGADLLAGGSEGDLYVIDSPADVVLELAGGGIDTVQSASSVAALAAQVEALVLTGTANINGTGNALDNLILGNGGNNILRGGNGADTIIPGTGQDSLFGEGGNDRIVLSGVQNAGGKYADGGAGIDQLVGGDLSNSFITGFETLVWTEPNSGINLTLGQLAQFSTLRVESDPSLPVGLLIMGGGAINLAAFAYDMAPTQSLRVSLLGPGAGTILGRDVADGFAADYIILNVAGAHSVATFGGDDSIFAVGGGATIDTGAGNDMVLKFEDGGVVIFGGAGDDTFEAQAGANTVDGGSGNDGIFGGSENDILRGGTGNDTIQGRGGNDTITGGAGADTLSGGLGADRFIYDDGHSGVLIRGQLIGFDTILDFNRAEGDKINLRLVDANTGLLGDQNFSAPLAASDPTPIGAGSLRYTVGRSSTIIEGSTDADADMEFRIVVLVPGYTPIATDFIL